MRYLCFVYCEDGRLETQTPAELEACMGEQLDYFEQLKAQGHAIAAHSLQPPETATCLRMRGGRVSITDGPFAETSELFGGFFILEAKDLNEAIRLAQLIPAARFGCIEVRPLR